MRLPHEAYRSKVYLNFKEIGAKEYQSIVRFFEQYEEDIRQLSFEEYFELLLAYMDALFEVGAYANYVESCDFAIESVIYFNVAEYNGERVYRKLLFRKAASYYHLMEYAKCRHILQELIRMDPTDQLAARFLKKCRRAQPPRKVRRARAVSVLLFIFSAMVIAFELLVVNSFFPKLGGLMQLLRNTAFGLGWAVLLGSGIYLRWNAHQSVQRQIQQIKASKKQKKLYKKRKELAN